MAPVEVVNGNGKLRDGRLKGLAKGLPDNFSVISALGPCRTGKSNTLNRLLGCEFAEDGPLSDRTTVGTYAEAVVGKDRVVLATPPRGLLVLDVEGADSRDQSRKQLQKMQASMALTLADVIMITMNARDIGRLDSSGISSLFESVEESLQLRSERVVPPSSTQLLVTAIRDFDGEEISRQEAIAQVMRDFQTALSSISRPRGYAATRLTDLFEFEFVTLPNESLFKDEYAREADAFRARLTNSTVDDYLFEKAAYVNGKSAPELAGHAGKIWNVMNQSSRGDAPDEEVNATYQCEQALKDLWPTFQTSIRRWKDEVGEGRIIRNFGKESEKALNAAMAEYDSLAEEQRGTKAFDRKRAELHENVLNELGALFTKQLVKVHFLVLESFREKLDRTPVTRKLEKVIDEKVKAAEKAFVAQAEEMKCKGSKWRHESYRNDLIKSMKEIATERLQMARLQGSYVPGLRPPVNVTFHYLNPRVMPEDFLPTTYLGDRPDRMITVPQKVRRDRSNKAEFGRMFSHQDAGFGNEHRAGTRFEVNRPF